MSTKSSPRAAILILSFLFALALREAQRLSFLPQALAQEAEGLAASVGQSIAYPLKPTANGRYLVDQNDVPFMIVGDSPQALIGNLSISDAAWYMKNRARYGINTLWINLLCNQGTACNADGTTFDGIAPFKVAGDLSTPNPAYFQRVDDMIALAAANDMLVLLDPSETRGWLSVLRANGIAKARNYGAFLGNRYRRFANIIWMHGNDFQTWRDMADDALVHAVASGIRSAGPSHLHTIELNYLSSASLDDSTWALSIGLDAVYTYYPTYALLLTEYNRRHHLPTFTVEANYEFEHNSGTDGGSPANLRRQEYWTMLSGATGGLYGSAFSWTFSAGWRDHLDTPGVLQLSYMRKLFIKRKWFDLIPDQAHTTVTAGYGEFNPGGTIPQNTYVTAARTGDGSLVMAYIPSARTLTIDMTRLAGTAAARWYDPANGTYRNVIGSPLVNSGSRQFATPGKNASGDDDWVLLLEVSPAPDEQPR
jgi:Protein of unknown function (DUF4038)/Putative collagen-binding domain of a collagenase